MEKRLEYDFWYEENRSSGLPLFIRLKTVFGGMSNCENLRGADKDSASEQEAV